MTSQSRSDQPLQVPCPRPRAVADESGRVVALVPARRERRHPCLPYVRFQARGVGHYEARYRMDRGLLGVVTLGLFRAEHAAHRAAVAFKRRGPSLDKYPAILAELVALGLVPATLLPKWVYRLPPVVVDGAVVVRFGARRRTREGLIDLAGPFDTPAEAFRAMLAEVRAGSDATPD